MRILDRIAHALDRAYAYLRPAPFVALPEAEFVVPALAPEPTPLRRGESVACPTCAAPAGRSCVYLRTARKGQFCEPHQSRLDAERPPTRRAAQAGVAEVVAEVEAEEPAAANR